VVLTIKCAIYKPSDGYDVIKKIKFHLLAKMDAIKGIMTDKYSININNNYEIEYWSIKLGITPTELLEIVEQLDSNSSLDVKKYLRERK